MEFLGLFAILILHMPCESFADNETNETNAFLDMLKLGLQQCPGTDFCAVKSDRMSSVKWMGCCKSCSCYPSCRVNRNCCPDAPVPATNPTCFQHATECRPVFLENKLYRDSLYNSKGTHFIMITRCPDGTSCLPVYNSGNITDVSNDDLTIVLDEATNTTYVNRKCAECNGARNTSRFTFMISHCEESLSVDHVKHEDIVQNIYERCAILSKPSKYQASLLTPCSKAVVDTCNQTGRWQIYNPLQEQLCLDPDLSFYAHHPGVVYKNIFCMMCNHDTLPRMRVCFDRGVLASFKEVFKIRRDSIDRRMAIRNEQCKESEIFDHVSNVCRHVYCPPLYASSYGTCTPLPIELQIATVTIYFRLYPVNINDSIEPVNEGTGYFLSDTNVLSESIRQELCVGECHLRSCHVFLFDASLQTPFPQSDHMSLYILYSVEISAERNCSYGSVAQCRDKLRDTPLQTSVTINNISTQFFVTYFEQPVPENDDVDIIFYIQPGDLDHLVADQRCHTSYTSNGKGSYEITMYGPHHCPYISMNSSEYCNMSDRDQRQCYIVPDFSNKLAVPKLTFGKYFNNDREYTYYYKICLKDYWSMIGHQTYMLPLEGASRRTSGIVSLSVTSASLLCILVSLRLIYKQQGQNFSSRLITIASQLSLFAALASFQFLSGWTKHTTLCLSSGIMVHYFWLSYVFVSGLYFFAIDFNLQNISPIQRYNKQVVRAVVLSFVAPSLFIMVNMLYTRVKFGDVNLGYDASFGTCLISTSLMRGLLFVAPILTTVLVNVIIFVHIIIRIRKISTNMYISNGRKYYATYVRLLMLVGIAWFIGFSNEFVRSPVMDYTFIILACGQGMWSMFSMLSIHYKRNFFTYLSSWHQTSSSQTGSSLKY